MFYEKLIGAFAEAASEMDCSKEVEETLQALAAHFAEASR